MALAAAEQSAAPAADRQLVELGCVPEGWSFRTSLTRRRGVVLRQLHLGAGVCVDFGGVVRSVHSRVLVEVLG